DAVRTGHQQSAFRAVAEQVLPDQPVDHTGGVPRVVGGADVEVLRIRGDHGAEVVILFSGLGDVGIGDPDVAVARGVCVVAEHVQRDGVGGVSDVLTGGVHQHRLPDVVTPVRAGEGDVRTEAVA